MIAVDTSILVYAHAESLPNHVAARAALKRLIDVAAPWGVPWPCAQELCAVVTNRNWRKDALSGEQAIAILDSWRAAPGFRFLNAGVDHLANLRRAVVLSHSAGGQIHDARIVAVCFDNAVSELWSADRDFSRFPGLRVRNPL